MRKDFQENTHDHRWAFASTMILGEYRTQILKKKQEVRSAESYPAEKLFHFVYESANAHIGGSNYEIKPVSQEKEELVIVEDALIVEGMSFIFPISTAHRIIDEVYVGSSAGAMTLMITAPSAKINCNLWSHTLEIGDDEEVAVAKFTKEQLIKRLEMCLYSLNAGKVVEILE